MPYENPVRTAVAITRRLMFVAFSYCALNAQPLPQPMASWSAATKNSQRANASALITWIDNQINAGVKNITVAPGHYRFSGPLPNSKTHISFRFWDDVTIDFQGSTFWFETGNEGISVSRSTNCTFRNLTMDWDPLPFMQGTITAINTSTNEVTINIDPGFSSPIQEWVNDTDVVKCRTLTFDPVTREMKPNVAGYSLEFKWAEVTPSGHYKTVYMGDYFSLGNSGLAVGDLVAIAPVKERAFTISTCESIALENITLYASPYLSFVVNGGKGDFAFRNITIDRRPGTSRLLASVADGINVGNTKTGPIIEDSSLNYLGDDGINIYSFYNRLIKSESGTSLISTPINGHAVTDINNGTRLKMVFIDKATMVPLGERYVTNVATVQNWTLNQNDSLAEFGSDPWNAGPSANWQFGQTKTVHRLTLDAPITITGDTITYVEGYISAGAQVRRNTITNAKARGMRLQSPDMVVQDNVIRNTYGYGISAGGQPNYWGEGPYVANTQIINNQLIDVAHGKTNAAYSAINVFQAGPYDQYYFQENITVANNIVVGSGGSALIARGIKNLVVADNTFSGYMQRPLPTIANPLPSSVAGYGHGIIFDHIDGLTFKGNTLNSPGAYSAGKLFTASVVDGPADDALNTGTALAEGTYGSGISLTPTTNDSPFPWLSNLSAQTYIDTTASSGATAGHKYTISPAWNNNTQVSVAFDFKMLNSGSNNLATTALLGNAAGTGGVFLRLWVPDGNGGYGIANQTNSGVQLLNIPVVLGKWYRVEMLVNNITQSNDVYTLVITNEDQEVFVVNDLPFRTALNDLASIRFIHNGNGSATGSYTIANVRAGTTPATDLSEPSAWYPVASHSHTSVGATPSLESSPLPWLGSEATLYTDATTSAGMGAGIGYEFIQNPSSDLTAVTFDFKIPNSATDNLKTTAGFGTQAGLIGNYLLLHNPDGAGGHKLAYVTNAGTFPLNMPVEPGKWHRVQMVTKANNGANDRFTLIMHSENQNTHVAANVPFRFSRSDLNQLRIWNNSNNNPQGGFIIDNVRAGFDSLVDSYGLTAPALTGATGTGTTLTPPAGTSPFTWLSQTGFTYSDTSTNYGSGAGALSEFNAPAASSPLIVTFDVKVPNSPPATKLSPTFTLASGTTFGIYLQMDYNPGSGTRYFANQTNSGMQTLTPVLANRWYRVQVQVNNVSGGSDTYNLSITDDNNVTSTFNNLPFRNNVTELSRVLFYNNSSGPKFGDFTIENLRLSTQYSTH